MFFERPSEPHLCRRRRRLLLDNHNLAARAPGRCVARLPASRGRYPTPRSPPPPSPPARPSSMKPDASTPPCRRHRTAPAPSRQALRVSVGSFVRSSSSMQRDHRQFKQRYYEFLDYYRAPNGPIFLYICGEASCNGIGNNYLAVMAKKFGAALVSPEHRYYGKSSPFNSLTTENLQFLSSKQALFDLAVFRQYYQETLNAKYNRSGADSSWFVFGGSYAGALSAWFRLKFPHLTCGSLASSGVVLAVYNFTDFDKQIGISAGPECKAALQEITRLVDGQLQSGRNSVKELFGAPKLENDGDFLYLLADAAAIAFQYGNPDVLCSPLAEAKKNGTDLVETFASYVKDYYIGKFGASVASYDQQYLKNTTPSESSYRLWWYQVCSEVAYFQVAPKNDSVRSQKIDTRYHLDLCRNVFGEGVFPDVFMTNLYYGGTGIAGSKIVFANGSQDPWQHASKQKSSDELPSYLIECKNCGHCSDLSGCPQAPSNIEGDSSKCSPPESLNKVRKEIVDHIDLWLSECQEQGHDKEPSLGSRWSIASI